LAMKSHSGPAETPRRPPTRAPVKKKPFSETLRR